MMPSYAASAASYVTGASIQVDGWPDQEHLLKPETRNQKKREPETEKPETRIAFFLVSGFWFLVWF